MKKRLGSILLACVMVLTLLPWSALPARAEGEKQAQPAHANGLYGVAPGDTVYFAKNKKGALAWRALSLSDDETLPVSKAGQMLLIAAEQMGISDFNPTESGNAWAGSTVQRYCQNILYKGIIEEWADVPELAAFVKTTVEETSGYSIYGPASLKDETLFLLSAEEADTYFQSDADRITHNEGGNNNVNWWLRSPVANDSTKAACVDADGKLSSHDITKWWYTTRPAFNLNASAVLYAVAAASGKAWDSTAIEPHENTTHIWKLTLSDSSRTGFAATVDRTAAEAGGTVTVSYSGARTGENEYVSALLFDAEGALLGYAGVPVTGASGTVTFTLPNRAGGSCTLKVFNELRNADYLSDYASNVAEFTLTVHPAPGASAETAFEISGTTEAEAWSNLKAALASNGTKRADGESADFPTYFKLVSSCTDGTRSNDSFIEVSTGRYVVIDLNGKKLDRGLGNAENWLNNGQVIRFDSMGKGALTIDDSAGGGVITGGYGQHGGGIFLISQSGQYAPALTLRGGTVTGNKAQSGGGVYLGTGAALTLCGGAITQNKAEGDYGDGGGVYCEQSSRACVIESGTVSGNTAGRYGGGIYTSSMGTGGAPLTIRGGAITGNKAASGGGLSVSASVAMSGGEISGNEATAGNGGGVALPIGTFTLTGGEIKNNTATGSGGGLHSLAGGFITLDGGTVSGNRASVGGGVYVGGSLTMHDGSRIVGNTAGNGGGVYVFYTQPFTMTGGEIAANEADVGGGVYIRRGVFTMTGGTITGNSAGRGSAGKGGGVYYFREEQDTHEASAFNVSGSPMITGNTVDGYIDGGVLHDKKADDNVYLARENATWTTRMTVTGALTAGARIGVTIRKNESETFVTDMVAAVAAADYRDGKLTAADVAHIKSDLLGYEVVLQNATGMANLVPTESGAWVYGDFNSDGALVAIVKAPAGGVLIAASYDKTGRQTAVRVFTLAEPADNEEIVVDGIKRADNFTYKLMLVDKTTYAPLCAAWEKKA